MVDQPKGYFPVPGIRHLEGPLLDQVRDALTSHAARDRGLFKPDHVQGLFARPNDKSNLGVNILLAARPAGAVAARPVRSQRAQPGLTCPRPSDAGVNRPAAAELGEELLDGGR